MELLKAAYDANLPIIQVQTDDLVNAIDVISYVLKKKPQKMPLPKAEEFKQAKPGLYYVVTPDADEATFAKLYEWFVKGEHILLVINPKKSYPMFFNAGTLPVPKALVEMQIEAVVDDPEKVKSIALRMGAANLKDVAELIRLTMVHTGGITAAGIAHTRRQLFKGSTGLMPINTEQKVYKPQQPLSLFVEREKAYFLHAKDEQLRPRGLLFDGPPGTGKSSGAKYIAEQWGIPCYMLSLAGVKSKWVGESQSNLSAAFATLDREEPCVVLLDEVEKYYSGGHDGDTSSEMLGQLLWWLQEHTSRVFTVMTTNNLKAIPPELYRPGRIDEVMTIGYMSVAETRALLVEVLKSFKFTKKEGIDQALKVLDQNVDAQMSKQLSPAWVVAFAKKYLKSVGFGI